MNMFYCYYMYHKYNSVCVVLSEEKNKRNLCDFVENGQETGK